MSAGPDAAAEGAGGPAGSAPPAAPAIDLHLHSSASDGLLAPEELVRRARRAGLAAIALSDHDTTAGLAAARLAAAEAPGLAVVAAIELTCRLRPGPYGTVHVLGYGVDSEAPALAQAARQNRAGKRAQVQAILQRLRDAERLEIPWEEVSAGRDPLDGYVGRHHVAAALIRRGLVKSRRSAFRRFLAAGRVPEAEVVTGKDAVAAIREAGGLAVLAHPTDLDLERHLRPLVEAGLSGLELIRPHAAPAFAERARRAAAGSGLLVAGGSDWHGHHPEPPLGAWRADARGLLPLLERLWDGAQPGAAATSSPRAG